MKYVECLHCGKKILLNKEAVARKGFIGYYCSWKCAAIESRFFNVVLVNEEEAQEDNIKVYESYS